MQDKVLYKTGADHFLQGLSKGIPIKKWQKKFTVYSPNHLKNAFSAPPPHKHAQKVTKRSSSCFWAAAPKGTKSCRTQGDFRSSFRPFVSQALNLPSQA